MKDNPFRKAIASRKQLVEEPVAEPVMATPIQAKSALEKSVPEKLTPEKTILKQSNRSTGAESLPMLEFPDTESPSDCIQPGSAPEAKLSVHPEIISKPQPVVHPEAIAPLKPMIPSVVEESPRMEVDIPRKRGRPATGKRSDGAWVGRTYYIKRETDLDIGELILQLRRQGIEVDKSELVDLLLSAWVKWHKGENIEIQLSEVSPIQK